MPTPTASNSMSSCSTAGTASSASISSLRAPSPLRSFIAEGLQACDCLQQLGRHTHAQPSKRRPRPEPRGPRVHREALQGRRPARHSCPRPRHLRRHGVLLLRRRRLPTSLRQGSASSSWLILEPARSYWIAPAKGACEISVFALLKDCQEEATVESSLTPNYTSAVSASWGHDPTALIRMADCSSKLLSNRRTAAVTCLEVRLSGLIEGY